MNIGLRTLRVACESLLVVCAALAFADSAAFADARADYMLHCQGCHGPQGRGVASGAPAFPQQIARFVNLAGGREYLTRVPGVAQSELNDARLAAVLNWVLYEFDAN